MIRSTVALSIVLFAFATLPACSTASPRETDGEIRIGMSLDDLEDVIGDFDEDRDSIERNRIDPELDFVWHYGSRDRGADRATYVFRGGELVSWTEPR